MFYETGCYGRVVLGKLPEETQERLAALPGEWLEFDPPSGAIVVRHCQPSSAPCLPTIARELVRMLAEVPGPQQEAIPGGDLYVHTESKGQLVRLRVQPGGEMCISWAHPDYSRAQRALYTGREALAQPHVQCLNGCVSFANSAPAQAAQQLETLADNFEGLYPEGDFVATADEAQAAVRVELHDVNLDVKLLVARLLELAVPSTLAGRIEVTSFAAEDPEHSARVLFEEGQVWVQRPVLWQEPEPAATPNAA